MSALISPAELQKILHQPDVKILDASYGLPPSSQGIPGVVDFDIDDVADPDASFAHTIPTADIFADKLGNRGIGNDDLVIVYDRNGLAMAAARAWWLFRLFGHSKVKVLNGGLPAWTRAGGAVVEKSAGVPTPAPFEASFKADLFKSLDQIEENMHTKNFTLLDARDAGRYGGKPPNGHIPGSLNIPFFSLLNPDGTLQSPENLEKIFLAAAVPLQDTLACSCGSGVTACVVALALHELGRKNVAVYDGSWTEWSMRT